MTESLLKSVYLGRGPGCYKQPGNNQYRILVKLYAADFHRNASMVEKRKFIDNLQAKLEMQGFQFFSYSEELQKWVDALDWEIKEKIGHDLRDNRKSLSNATTKKSSTFSKPPVNKGNHVMLNYPIDSNEFEFNGVVEKHVEFSERKTVNNTSEPNMENRTIGENNCCESFPDPVLHIAAIDIIEGKHVFISNDFHYFDLRSH